MGRGEEFLAEEQRLLSSELYLYPKETFGFALPWWSGDCSDSLPTASLSVFPLPPHLTLPFNLSLAP